MSESMVKNSLKDLTLVVPTYFRQSFVLRLMRYWSGRGAKVIVLDGTDDPISKVHLDAMDPSIVYIHNPVGFYERLGGALDLIETKYTILAGDDEFYIPSALARCIRELEDDSELVACSGTAIGFCPEASFIRGLKVYPRLVGYEILATDAKVRVLSHMSDYEVNQIYAVCRSRQWKIVMRAIVEKRFPVYAILEYQFQMYMSFAGKSKVVNELMWLRSVGENEPVNSKAPFINDGRKGFYEWFVARGSAGDVCELLCVSAKTFCELSGSYDSESAREIANSGFRAFHNWLKAQMTLTERFLASPLIIFVLRFLSRNLPSVFKRFGKRFIGNFYSVSTVKDQILDFVHLRDFASELERDFHIRVSYSEISEIEGSILQSRASKFT